MSPCVPAVGVALRKRVTLMGWVGFLLLMLLLAGCSSWPSVGAAPASPLPPTLTLTVAPTPTPTLIPSPTPSPTPALTPTPAPTISLGFLVGEAPTLTPTPALFLPTENVSLGLPSHATLPGRVIPEPFGVNIHFTRPDPGEMELLAGGGFRFVRMDLFWHTVEREIPGRYDFSAYDHLVEVMTARNIRLVFILDYGNDLYGGGNAHHFDAGRAAFARFAAAAARRYRGKGIVWEIWNEPNLEKYWHGPPDPVYYNKFASEVITAIRRVDPTALIIGPATAGFPWEYLETLAALGLFNKLDAVSVHPYRFNEPESAWEDYARLRGILDRVSPERKIPIIAGEWGYSTVEGGPTELEQAQYVARQALAHLAYDVDLSIWYDWRNDGDDPREIEFNFGLVRHDLSPKPAYHAMRVLVETLRGYGFQRRLPLNGPAEFGLLFRNEAQVALALWTNGTPRAVTLPVVCEAVTVVEMDGKRKSVPVAEGLLTLRLERAPQYVLLCDAETHLRQAVWRPVDSIHVLQSDGVGRVLVEVENPFPAALQGELEVRVNDTTLGRTWVQVRPGTAEKFSIPVALPLAQADVIPAVVEFITPDNLPLQSAALWLHIPGAK